MLKGTVTAAFGRHYEIVLPDGQQIQGIPRGKRSPFACGDIVNLGSLRGGEAQILGHAPRTSLLYRSDAWKQKLIAANATQVVFVVATEPAFSLELLSRALVAIRHEQMRLIVVLNKTDRKEGLVTARTALAPFARLGIPILELSALADASPLHPYLRSETTVLVGQSGMGKSTLVNALVPEAAAATREISTALDSGKHTTTHARLYELPAGGRLIDSPGLQEFGLAHLTRGEIELGFAEFVPLLGNCRFRDCRHIDEPGCAIRSAIAAKNIDACRLDHFIAITGEIDRGKHY